MAPEHNFFFWNYPENANRIPANFDRALAMQIFRQGRMYEQLKQAEAKNRKPTKKSLTNPAPRGPAGLTSWSVFSLCSTARMAQAKRPDATRAYPSTRPRVP